MPALCIDRCGVEVLEQAMIPLENMALAHALLVQPHLFCQIAALAHGYRAVQQALRIAAPAQRRVALAELTAQRKELMSLRYGRVLVKFLDEQCESLKSGLSTRSPSSDTVSE